MTSPKVIDLRCRPAFLHDFFGANPGSPGYETARWLNRRVSTRGPDDHFSRSLTQEGFLAEIREAGLSKAVVVGRHTPGQQISNRLIHEITHGHDELLGIAGVDPVLQGTEAALQEINHAITQLGLAGIDLEPGFGKPARHPDDAVYYPVYEECSRLGVPVFLMTGPTTPDLRYNDPAALSNLAKRYPDLPIVCYHGYWPNAAEAVGAAFLHQNIFLVPDMYLFQPGSQVYVDAANSFLGEQLLFGSSYPFRPIRQSIDDFLQLGFKEDRLEKLLYENAARLFGLND